jgi:hypothetical protein
LIMMGPAHINLSSIGHGPGSTGGPTPQRWPSSDRAGREAPLYVSPRRGGIGGRRGTEKEGGRNTES